MKRLRFGVIGCGGVSTFFQLPALRRCDQVELVCVADIDHGHVRTVARRFDVPRAYTDYHEIIGQIDAALIATPNVTHTDIACTLLERGVHVLCEKPMATTLADAERMQEAATRTGARLMSAQCLRFSPNVSMLKQIVDDGFIGNVRGLSGGLGGPYSGGMQRTDFRKLKSLAGGGVLMDLGVHLIDVALWITADIPRSVAYAGSSSPGWEVENDAEVAIEFAHGARAFLFCSLTHALDNTLVVRGEAGWVSAPLYEPTKLSLFSHRARICQRNGVQRVVLPDTSEYERQIDHFCGAVRSGRDFIVLDHEIRSGIRIIEGCYGSVTLPEVAHG